MKLCWKKSPLTRHPKITISYNHKTSSFEIKLRKPVTFKLHVLTEGKTFETYLRERLVQGQDPETATLEIIGSQTHPEIQLRLDQEEIGRVGEAVVEAMRKEHKVEVAVKLPA